MSGAAAPRRVDSPSNARGAPLRVELLQDTESLASIHEEWSALSDACPAGCLFLTPQWLLPWWRQFGVGRDLRCLAVREGSTLVGFWPLFAERVRIGGVESLRTAFLGDGATGCDGLDLISAPGRELEVLEAALGALGDLPWDLCDLDGLFRESDTARELALRFPPERFCDARGGGLFGPAAKVLRDSTLRYVCPYIPLEGSYDEYLTGLGRRENLRRREKWLVRQPGVSVQVARAAEEASAALDAFLTLHRARWAADGGSDGLVDARDESFHREVAPLLARSGWLRFYTLFAARRPVASVYGAVHRGRFLYYQSGYDPLWASRSVGLVLLARTVEEAFREGLSEFDFLRGNEAYKTDWVRARRWTVRIRLWRGARGRAARAAQGSLLFLRERVKATLPEEALQAVRRARRILRRPPPEGKRKLAAALRAFGLFGPVASNSRTARA